MQADAIVRAKKIEKIPGQFRKKLIAYSSTR
jgi:hypothetical protein